MLRTSAKERHGNKRRLIEKKKLNSATVLVRRIERIGDRVQTSTYKDADVELISDGRENRIDDCTSHLKPINELVTAGHRFRSGPPKVKFKPFVKKSQIRSIVTEKPFRSQRLLQAESGELTELSKSNNRVKSRRSVCSAIATSRARTRQSPDSFRKAAGIIKLSDAALFVQFRHVEFERFSPHLNPRDALRFVLGNPVSKLQPHTKACSCISLSMVAGLVDRKAGRIYTVCYCIHLNLSMDFPITVQDSKQSENANGNPHQDDRADCFTRWIDKAVRSSKEKPNRSSLDRALFVRRQSSVSFLETAFAASPTNASVKLTSHQTCSETGERLRLQFLHAQFNRSTLDDCLILQSNRTDCRSFQSEQVAFHRLKSQPTDRLRLRSQSAD